MACDPEYVTGYVDAELAPWREQEVERHLSVCLVCAAQAAFELELRDALGSLTGKLPPGLADRVISAVRLDAHRRAH